MRKQIRLVLQMIVIATVWGVVGQFPVMASDDSRFGQGPRTPVPTDFRKLIMFVTSTPFTSVDGSFYINGVFGGNGLNFQRNVMQRNDFEIGRNRSEAITFFNSRFGVDVSNPGVYFTGFEGMQDINYRAVIISNENVPRKGWNVNDGGWLAIVTNPAGLTLGGQFAGVHVPQFTMFIYGDYKVDRPHSPIVLHFQSRQPILPAENWKVVIDLDIHNEEYGRGHAIGATMPVRLPDGRLVFNTRNVITFPPFGEEVEALLPH